MFVESLAGFDNYQQALYGFGFRLFRLYFIKKSLLLEIGALPGCYGALRAVIGPFLPVISSLQAGIDQLPAVFFIITCCYEAKPAVIGPIPACNDSLLICNESYPPCNGPIRACNAPDQLAMAQFRP